MKSRSYTISIKNPCNEIWDAMKPVGVGKFCSSCSKVVIDFSAMSEEAIALFLKENTGKKVCGNFRVQQLQQTYSISARAPFFFNSALLRYSLAGLLLFAGAAASAQSVGKGVKIEHDDSGKNKTPVTQANGRTLVFKVTDENGYALNGVEVTVEGLKKTFYSKKGEVRIVLPKDFAKVAEVKFVSANFLEKTVQVSTASRVVHKVKMEMKEIMVKGEIDIIEYRNKCGNK